MLLAREPSLPFKWKDFHPIPDLKEGILEPCCQTVLDVLYDSYGDFKVESGLIAKIAFWRLDNINYELLATVDDSIFDAYFTRSMSAALKRWNYIPKCDTCWENVTSPENARKFTGIFTHKWDCAIKYYEENFKNEGKNFFEKRYWERVASWVMPQRDFYIRTYMWDYWTTVYHSWWENSISDKDEYSEFSISYWSEDNLSLEKNESIWIFFRLIRFIIENWFSIEYLILELEKQFSDRLLKDIWKPLKNYRWFLENSFSEPNYDKIETNQHNYVSIAFSVKDAVSIVMWIIHELWRKRKWAKYYSLLQWIRDIESGDFNINLVCE